jgi:serine/threonine protein kinase
MTATLLLLTMKIMIPAVPRTRNTTAGTPNYMAPELLDGRPFSRSVDVYAFGIVLHEILTGEVFLDGYDTLDIRRQVLAGERPRVPTIDCPEAVQRLMQRCW